jgi:hypothetical protein
MQLRRCETPARNGGSSSSGGSASNGVSGGDSGRGARRTRALGNGWRRAALLSGAALAIAAAPVALASGGEAGGAGRSGRGAHAAILSDKAILRGGIHNPASSSFFRTTGLFSNTGGWTLRVKNLGGGGATTLGCKAAASGSACLEAENSNGGLAFEFASTGGEGGRIDLTDPNGAPFTTNAHGEAKGLNANYLQGKQASEFQLVSQPAANANALGGVPASEYVKTSGLMFANLASDGDIQSTRGATGSTKSGTSFAVTFGTANVSKCSLTASPVGAALSSGALAVEPSSGEPSTVTVNAPSGFGDGVDLQVVC